MRKHTTIDLDMELLGQASVALETKQINETIHAALREVVAARRRRRLLDLRPDLTLDSLAEDRRGRARPGPHA
jgi:Arc/MetJ family transcription regulator